MESYSIDRFYWTMYLEFIEKFKTLTYMNIPLPLVCPSIYTIYDDQYFKLLFQKTKKYYNNSTIHQKLIQPTFDRFIHPFKKTPLKKLHGKTLIYEHALFLNNDMLKQYFLSENTIIIREQEAKHHLGHSIYGLNKYQMNKSEDVYTKLKIEANSIFISNNNHVVFNDAIFQKKFLDEIPIIVDKISAVSNFFEQNSVSSIIVGETKDFLARILVLVGAAKGIPSICVQHGIMAQKNSLPILVDKQGVYGNYEKKVYLNYGVSMDKLVELGHPRFDEIFNKTYKDNILYKVFNIDQHKKIVLIATQYDRNISQWEPFIKDLLKDSSIEILIKPHITEIRRGLLTDYKNKFGSYKSVKIISNEVDLYSIISGVDYVVTETSTVGLESLLFNKTVLFYNANFFHDYYDEMGVFVQSDPIKLSNNLKRLNRDKSYQQYYDSMLKNFLLHNYKTKNSSQTILDLLLKFKGERICWENKERIIIVKNKGLGIDSFEHIEGDIGGMRLGMEGGKKYTFSAYGYVPSFTGLNPDSERGLKVVVFWKEDEVYFEKRSSILYNTETWQRLSVSFEIPINATEAFIRIYNGFQDKKKEVYYKDFQLTENHLSIE